MRPYPTNYIDSDDAGAVGMDVDDADSLEMLASAGVLDVKLADADFFNSFEDDFDDSDIS